MGWLARKSRKAQFTYMLLRMDGWHPLKAAWSAVVVAIKPPVRIDQLIA